MVNPEEKYGVKIEYDPLWKGPMKIMRFSTDRIWLIVFVIFLFIYGFTALYGFQTGNFAAINYPTDTAGRICGYDPEVENKSNLMYLELTSCIPELSICTGKTACVSECPTENFLFKEEKNKPVELVKEKLICTTDVNITTITNMEQIEILVKHGRCAPFYLESESIRHECVPKKIWPGHEADTISEKQLKVVQKAILGEYDYIKNIAKDSKEVLSTVILTIFIGAIIALASVVLLRWFAVPFFYTSICVFCCFATYVIYRLIVNYVQTHRNDSLFGVIVFTIILVLTIIAVIYFRKKIYLACLLIKESSKAVQHLPLTLIFPIIPWFFYIIIVALGIAVLAVLYTITVPVYEIELLDHGNSEICLCQDYPDSLLNNSMPCDPDTFNSKCKTLSGEACLFLQCRLQDRVNPTYVRYFHVINIIGVYWFVFFVSGFEYMVLGGTFASWYWTYNKNNISNFSLSESIFRTVRYHLGSIAIGSLILTISQLIKLIFRGLQQSFSRDNNVAAGFMMCCRSIFEMIDSFLTFINYNAYIMCAIHGKSFFQSAKSAFQLVMRNVVKVIVVNTVADMLFLMVKLLITNIVVVVSLAVYYTANDDKPEDDGPRTAALILSTVGTYIVISVFFSVQSVAVNTIFLCFIEDSERNDGTEDKPYYMSNQLKQLLHK